MYDVDVEIYSSESHDNQNAELSVDGKLFAFTRLVDAQVVIEITGPATIQQPLILNAHSLIAALERGRELLE